MELIDLHVHSSASDGTLSPAAVTALALETGLAAYALTDHDTTDGVREAVEAAKHTPLEVIPGAELSALYGGCEIHILGLYVNPESRTLREALEKLRADRARRNDEMLALFQRDGFPIARGDLEQGAPGQVITRAHFARALVKKGCVSSMEQAFQRYLDHGKKYCPQKKAFEPQEAVRLIREAGGFPALAHPVQYKLGRAKTEAMVQELTEMGLMGIEVYYSSHTRNDSLRLKELCLRYGLLPTGGSDFHGGNKPDIRIGTGRGGLRVSALLLEDIRKSVGRL